MIPPGFIAELLSRVDIVDVIGRHVQLKKGGANLMGLCPFHAEKSPSFSVSPSKQFYYCFGCGASGDAIRFLTEHTGASFRDAVTELAAQVGLTVPDDARSEDERRAAAESRQRAATLTEVLERAAAHYRKQLKASPRAIDYLKSRGLTGEIAARFGLGYAPEGWHALAAAFSHYDDPLLAEAGLVIVQGEDGPEQKRYDRFRDRIMFPIRSVQGDAIGFGGRVIDQGEPKYLNSPETPVFVKGRELYGLHESRAGIRARGYALVVEGYMDVVALAQSGFDNAVATLGTACSEEHVRKLFRFTDAVVFSFDGDAAGRRAAARALEATLPHATDLRSVRFLFLPPEHDPDSFVRQYGAAAFERAIQQAVPLSRQMIAVAREGCDLGTAELASTAAMTEPSLGELWAVSRAARARSDANPSAGRPSSRTSVGSQRAAPRSPTDRILQLLLSQPAWWDRLTAEDHEMLHALPSPHGELAAWLEREVIEHGPRPWASVRAALQGDSALAERLAALEPGDSPEFEPSLGDLRVLLDGLLLARLEAEQRQLVDRVASEANAMDAYRSTQARIVQLRRRIEQARGSSA